MEYKPDLGPGSGMARFLRESPDLRVALLRAAEVGAAAARAKAPVKTGAFRDSIRAESAGIDKDRQAARVVAEIRYAADVEFRRGSEHPLQAAVNAIEAGS